MSYQGWNNYETWATNLWLSNDHGLYDMVRDWAREALDQPNEDDWEQAGEHAVRVLADQIKEYLEEQSPLAEAGLYSDLLHAAMSEIDYAEIAEHWITDAQQ